MFTTIKNQVGCFHHQNKRKFKMLATLMWMVENKIKAKLPFLLMIPKDLFESQNNKKQSTNQTVVLSNLTSPLEVSAVG